MYIYKKYRCKLAQYVYVTFYNKILLFYKMIKKLSEFIIKLLFLTT